MIDRKMPALREKRPGKYALEYLMVLTIIMISSSPLLEPLSRSVITFFLLAFLIFNNHSLQKGGAWRYITIIAAFSVPMAIDFYYSSTYGLNTLSGFYMVFSLIFSARLAESVDYEKFSLIFQKVIWHLSIIAIVSYAIFIIFPGIVNLGFDYKYYDFPGKSFVFQNFLYGDGLLVARNSGFASEPGVFQLFINLAVALGLSEKRIGLGKLAVYGITILTSASTAGLVIFSAVILLKSPLNIRVAALILAIPVNGLIMGYFLQHYEAKFVTEYAWNLRFDPALNALNLFWENPLGFGSIRYTHYLDALDIGSWDAYTQAMVRFGLTGFLFLIFLLARLAWRDIALAMVIALSLTTNSIWFTPGVAIFFFFGSLNSLGLSQLQGRREPRSLPI